MDDETGKDFYAIVGRALMDPHFRQRLLDENERAKALQDAEISLTDEQQQLLGQNINSLINLAANFGVTEVAS